MHKPTPVIKKSPVSSKSGGLKCKWSKLKFFQFVVVAEMDNGLKSIAERLKAAASKSFNSDPNRESKAQFLDRINQMYNTQVCITLKSEEINRLSNEMVLSSKAFERKVQRHHRDVANGNLLLLDSDSTVGTALDTRNEKQLLHSELIEQIQQAENLLKSKREQLERMKLDLEAVSIYMTLFEALHACDYQEGVSKTLKRIRQSFNCEDGDLRFPCILPPYNNK